jgi:hypothetical protein
MNYKKLTDLEKNRVLDEVVAYNSLLEDKKRLAAQKPGSSQKPENQERGL